MSPRWLATAGRGSPRYWSSPKLDSVKFFLIEYHQGTGAFELKHFDDRRAALRARLASEELHANDPQMEIVVLGARSQADLMRTHSRYFKSVGELAVG